MKRTLKVMLVALISVAMLAGFALAAEAEAVELSVHHDDDRLESFVDAPSADSWKYQGLNCAVNNGIMNGHEDKLRPDDSLTRAEMVAMMVRVLDAHNIKADVSAFVDVSSGSWYYDYISSGVAANFINGSGNKMMPNSPITREQTFAVLARTFLFVPKTADASASFSDEAKLSSWAEYATNALIDAKVVLGDSTNTLRPSDNVTRAEMAALLDRIVCYFLKSGVDYSGRTIEGSVILSDASVNLNGVTINGDLYIVDGLGKAEVDLSGVTVTGRVVIRGGEAKIPAGSNMQIVRPEDYNENPQKPDTPVEPDDKEEDKPVTGGGGGGSLPSGSLTLDETKTYISYGDSETKVPADIEGKVITFDLSGLSDPATVLKNLYVKANKNVNCGSDYFDELSFNTNVEKSVSVILAEMVNSTSGAIADLIGIDYTVEEGEFVINEEFTIGNLSETVETAYAFYIQDNFRPIFEGRGIEVSDWTEVSFTGKIGGTEYTIVMIVPEFGLSGGGSASRP
ncbi:MAG: S-layer homology domain-containing protein [Oscillospiraceae bacterium]|nr:S-layer homology domain-containing protein [Oscillospiraceae bacterium]